jgi:hypothetical protein
MYPHRLSTHLQALRRRGVREPAASLTADAGIAVLRNAFERWINDLGQRSFSLAELHSVMTGRTLSSARLGSESKRRWTQVVNQALEAATAERWDELRLLLHPYLHWTEADGVTLRGRSNVLNWLVSHPTRLAPPERFELRDGQIYRWWCS